ncbi:MAG: helix-turn-helix domain-containing protein [Ectobacillus sp.]
MERKLTKQEFKAVRQVLGLTQVEFSELLGVSTIHVSRTERRPDGANSYDVSMNLDKKVKDKLQEMGLDIEQILEVARKGGLLNG